MAGSFYSIFIAIALPCLVWGAKIPYTVQFIGVDDPATLQSLKSVSDLMLLKERPPGSINAIRYRAQSDVPEIIKVLHAHGYYEATVDIRIEEQDEEATVFVMVQTGAVYRLSQYEIFLYCGQEPIECP